MEPVDRVTVEQRLAAIEAKLDMVLARLDSLAPGGGPGLGAGDGGPQDRIPQDRTPLDPGLLDRAPLDYVERNTGPYATSAASPSGASAATPYGTPAAGPYAAPVAGPYAASPAGPYAVPVAGAYAAPAPAPYVDPSLEPILELVRQGRKIQAIKAYRERTGAGLRQAKEVIDAMALGQYPQTGRW
ncbi:hypothetical protein [Streptacidiphilus neutrinimicus]|uniref:hypothetical protein n=1 Tax=Streptacidiphilus neutrinimicus TaxID=105420 RepID=UPI001376F7B2|nr:hypothetical protein [Streptacidiphilus neutrinimicus]